MVEPEKTKAELDSPNKTFEYYLGLKDPLGRIYQAMHEIVFENHAERADPSRLSAEAQVLYLTFIFDVELDNGGMEQFFLNSSGTYALETFDALEMIGAKESAKYLQTSLEFLGALYSPSIGERRVNLSFGGEKLIGAFRALDHAYYETVTFDNAPSEKKESLSGLLLDYLRSKPNATVRCL